MNILEEIAEYTKKRVDKSKENISLEEMKSAALSLKKGDFSFERQLKKKGLSFICECKKASPSKGIIAEDFPYLKIAKEYEMAGADCISVLTEPHWFLGKNEYLKEIASEVHIPIIRKDFTVDEYMIYEAKVLGASAVLLIVSLLDEETLKKYISICDELGLSALVETHDEKEVKCALGAGARIIGVNNRNLKDFSVDTTLAGRLKEKAGPDVIFVSESGMRDENDIKNAVRGGADAVLIGETLMRAEDKTKVLARFKEAASGSRVKLCGLKREEDILAANSILPDFIGFVFAKKSRRYVDYETADSLKKLLNPQIKAVGVFVNEDMDAVIKALNDGIIDMAQLHGDEDEAYIKSIKDTTGKPVIKAVKVNSREDVVNARASIADYVLLDAGDGSGNTFDWNIITDMGRDYFLAGGLSIENVADAINTLSPFAVDVSSGIETDGVKDEKKMKEFVSLVRRIV